VTATVVGRERTRGRATPEGPSTAVLSARTAALREAVEAGGDRWSPGIAERARTDLDRVAARLALGVDRTLVALVGGTGSGKSSLFNAISGLAFAEVGVRRPTTDHPTACVWGGEAGPLLDHLDVPPSRRIRRDSALEADPSLDGLVLLDLPDNDSVDPAHGRLVDRLLPLVDLLLWVVDPQKYADNVLHEQYLSALAHRQDGMIVLVNQVDTVPADGVARIEEDVRRLLERDGLRGVPVIRTSAVRRTGIEEVRRLLRDAVAGESVAAWLAGVELDAVRARLAEDLRPSGDGAAPGAGERLDAAAQGAVERLATAVDLAAAAEVVREAVGARRRGGPPADPASWLGRTPPLPTAESVRAGLVDAVTRDLPPRWARAVDAAVGDADTLRCLAAVELARVPLPPLAVGRGWRWATAATAVVAVALALGSWQSGAARAATLLAIGAFLAVGFLLAARVARRRAAAERSAAFAANARTALRAAVDHVLTRPAAAVRAQRRAVWDVLESAAAPVPPQRSAPVEALTDHGRL
jgi:GTP-binding protein EngB required for normal cell division